MSSPMIESNAMMNKNTKQTKNTNKELKPKHQKREEEDHEDEEGDDHEEEEEEEEEEGGDYEEGSGCIDRFSDVESDRENASNEGTSDMVKEEEKEMSSDSVEEEEEEEEETKKIEANKNDRDDVPKMKTNTPKFLPIVQDPEAFIVKVINHSRALLEEEKETSNFLKLNIHDLMKSLHNNVDIQDHLTNELDRIDCLTNYLQLYYIITEQLPRNSKKIQSVKEQCNEFKKFTKDYTDVKESKFISDKYNSFKTKNLLDKRLESIVKDFDGSVPKEIYDQLEKKKDVLKRKENKMNNEKKYVTRKQITSKNIKLVTGRQRKKEEENVDKEEEKEEEEEEEDEEEEEEEEEDEEEEEEDEDYDEEDEEEEAEAEEEEEEGEEEESKTNMKCVKRKAVTSLKTNKKRKLEKPKKSIDAYRNKITICDVVMKTIQTYVDLSRKSSSNQATAEFCDHMDYSIDFARNAMKNKNNANKKMRK